MKMRDFPPTLKFYQPIEKMADAVCAVDHVVSPVLNESWIDATKVWISSHQLADGAPFEYMAPEKYLKVQEVLEKVDWLAHDYYHDLYSGLYKQVDGSAFDFKYFRTQRGSSARIEALKARVRRSKRKFKKGYFRALQTLRETLNPAEFNALLTEISYRIKPVTNRISRMHGKLRAIFSRNRSANGSIDRRIVYRKKYNVLFKRSVDEDLSK